MPRIIGLLILFEIIFSLYFVWGEFNDNGICDTTGCTNVQESLYSKILGVKLIYIALVCFILLYVFYEKHPKGYRVAVSIGFVSALILIFLQFFVIKSLCRDCLIIDVTMIIIFVLSVIAGNMQNT